MDEKPLKKRPEILTSGQVQVSETAPGSLGNGISRPAGAPCDVNNKLGADILPLASARRYKRLKARPVPRERVPIERQIGQQLKSIYDDVLAQPVPDRFLELLRELEAGSDSSKGNAGA